MSLPRVIEYLLTLDLGEGNLVLMAMNQATAIIPPFQRINIISEPADVNFAEICYKISFDSLMVPGTIYAEGEYYGSRPYGGVLSQWVLDNQLDTLVVSTHQQKASSTIQNLTNLDQYYSIISFVLIVPSQKCWAEIVKALKRLETSTESIELHQQTVNLLRQAGRI